MIIVYRGHVVSGVIQLEGAVVLPEGAEVRVELTTSAKEESDSIVAPPIEETLRAIVADVPKEEWDRLPSDLSDNLDHYIYGTRNA